MLHLRNGIRPIYFKVLRNEALSWKEETLSTMSVPLSFFLAFGLGLRDYIHMVDGVSYMAFLFPGLVSMTILFEAYRTGGWGLWLDRWYQKMIHEYRIKPITTSDIIIGEILGGFTVALIKGTLVAGILALLAPIVFPWQHLGAYLLYLFPGCILFTCVGTMIGTVFRKPDQIAQFQMIVITPLLYLGGMFFPVSSFPAWLLPVVRWFPTTILFENGRSAFLAGDVQPVMLAVLWGTALLSFAAATALFNHKLSE